MSFLLATGARVAAARRRHRCRAAARARGRARSCRRAGGSTSCSATTTSITSSDSPTCSASPRTGAIRIHAPAPPLTAFGPEGIAQLLQPPLFPLPIERWPMPVEIVPYSGPELEIGELRLRLRRQKHPGGSVGVRIGDALAYVTDTRDRRGDDRLRARGEAPVARGLGHGGRGGREPISRRPDIPIAAPSPTWRAPPASAGSGSSIIIRGAAPPSSRKWPAQCSSGRACRSRSRSRARSTSSGESRRRRPVSRACRCRGLVPTAPSGRRSRSLRSSRR